MAPDVARMEFVIRLNTDEFSGLQGKRNVIDRADAAKVNSKVLDIENWIGH
jgi:hypothetical protein